MPGAHAAGERLSFVLPLGLGAPPSGPSPAEACPFLARFDPAGPAERAKRRRVFWAGCLPLRIVLATCAALAGAARHAAIEFVLGTLLLLLGAGFVYRWVRQALWPQRPDHRGIFNGLVWWQPLRAVHGPLLLAYGIGTLARWEHAYAFAIADVALAALAGAVYFGLLERAERVPS